MYPAPRRYACRTGDCDYENIAVNVRPHSLTATTHAYPEPLCNGCGYPLALLPEAVA